MYRHLFGYIHKCLHLAKDEWNDTGWTASENKTVHMEIIVSADGTVSYVINIEGGEAVTGKIDSTRAGDSLSFVIFNSTADDAAKTVSVKNLTVTAL